MRKLRKFLNARVGLNVLAKLNSRQCYNLQRSNDRCFASLNELGGLARLMLESLNLFGLIYMLFFTFRASLSPPSHSSPAPGLCQDLWAQASFSLDLFPCYVAQIKSSALICYCSRRFASGFQFPSASQTLECRAGVRSRGVISTPSNHNLSQMISWRWWMGYTKADKTLIFFKLMKRAISPHSWATQDNLTNFPKLYFQDTWIIFISWNVP